MTRRPLLFGRCTTLLTLAALAFIGGHQLLTAQAQTETAAEAAAQPPAASSAAGEQYALLVGCTRYPALTLFRQLRGPANDVLLTRELLVDRFGFPAEHITVLADEGADARPLRENIVHQFEQLISQVREGDQVVILLAGHGSQQPDDDPANPADFEPDGLDEVFCPADINGLEDNGSGRIVNGITDDEIRGWLAAMTGKGADVWIVIDACHSGTMTRDLGDAVPRGLPPEELVPAAALLAARTAAAEIAPPQGFTATATDLAVPSGTRGTLVAMYAAQPHELTYEKKLPIGSRDAERYGVLSYAVNDILRQSSSPISYRELARQVHERYLEIGGRLPTPMIEGDALDSAVLGAGRWSAPAAITFTPAQEGGYIVSAGALHGLSAGSILAVYPPGGGEPAGYLRLSEVYTTSAAAEPCEFEDMAAVESLPAGGACQVVYRDYGDHRLPVAAASLPEGASPAAQTAHDELSAALESLAASEHALLRHVAAEDAQWLLCVEGEEIVIAPAGELATAVPTGTITYNTAGDETLADRLSVPLGRIARAQNLLAIAAAATHENATAGLNVEVTLMRYQTNRPQEEGTPVDWSAAGLAITAGDLLGFTITNHGESPIDVSLLYVDSGYGIYPYFPRPGVVGDNRIQPRERLATPRALAGEATTAAESMVVIAVPATVGGPRADFTLLAQPSIESLRADTAVFESPLGGLLSQALYGQGTTRGLTRTDAARTWLGVASWHVLPAE